VKDRCGSGQTRLVRSPARQTVVREWVLPRSAVRRPFSLRRRNEPAGSPCPAEESCSRGREICAKARRKQSWYRPCTHNNPRAHIHRPDNRSIKLHIAEQGDLRAGKAEAELVRVLARLTHSASDHDTERKQTHPRRPSHLAPEKNQASRGREIFALARRRRSQYGFCTRDNDNAARELINPPREAGFRVRTRKGPGPPRRRRCRRARCSTRSAAPR